MTLFPNHTRPDKHHPKEIPWLSENVPQTIRFDRDRAFHYGAIEYSAYLAWYFLRNFQDAAIP